MIKINRYDSVDEYYENAERINTLTSYLFYIISLLSYANFFLDDKPWIVYLRVSFIILAILNFILYTYNRIVLIPLAEEKRRTHFISNSLNIKLDDEKTVNYYNNSIIPSIKRLGANLCENTFFSKEISNKMLKTERTKVVIYIVIWLIIISIRSIDLNIVLITAQTIFSTDIILKYIDLELFHNQQEKIFKELDAIFLMNNDKNKEIFEAKILDLAIKSEGAKSYCGIKIPSDLFHQLNGELTDKWNDVSKRLDLN